MAALTVRDMYIIPMPMSHVAVCVSEYWNIYISKRIKIPSYRITPVVRECVDDIVLYYI